MLRQQNPDLNGIGVAFVVDSLTFLVSALTLWQIRVSKNKRESEADEQNILRSIMGGLRYAWRDPILKRLLIFIMVINAAVSGPMTVGIAAMADSRFDGSTSFGLLLSGFGIGTLLGTIIVGVLPKPGRRLGHVFIVGLLGLAITLALFGLSSTIWMAVVVAVMIGIMLGFINIQMLAWVQGVIAENMMGRFMSLIMFASLGMAPISTVVAGALIPLSLTGVFVGVGITVAIINRSDRFE